jgi:DNA mismatch repair protein MutS
MTQALHHSPECSNSSTFRSILFNHRNVGRDIDGTPEPEFFADLNLDQVVASITAGRDEYNLKPYFYTPLSDVEAINYRYDILQDLDNQELFHRVKSFAQDMRTMRDHLVQAEKLHYKSQRDSWFLDAVDIYCGAVRRITRDLAGTSLCSRGFLALREYLTSYIGSNEFELIVTDTEKLKAGLSGVHYSILLQGKRITVTSNTSEPDYGADVLQTFNKFKQGTAKQYRFRLSSAVDMNHVEAAILDMVAQLYPEVFLSLDAYCTRHRGYLQNTIRTFDREVQFYIACFEYVDRLKQAGLVFCRPTLTDRSKEIHGYDVFDLALAGTLIQERMAVITNDFYLRDPERIIVVSGPNQGGKTTFARTFGQLHYLASIGCPVPGREGRLFLFDSLFTHFEKEEDIGKLSSKLEDELIRIHRIIERATSNSILIMNESFLSTTLNDALFLSKEIMQRIKALGMLCVSVTFLDELASLDETIVSMVSTISPEDPALRTFKVIRKTADGLAYAVAIAEKYGLTYDLVRGRITTVKGGIGR